MDNYYLRGPIVNNSPAVYLATIFSTTINGTTYKDLYFLVKYGQSYVFTAELITPQPFLISSVGNTNQNVIFQEANNLGTYVGTIQQNVNGIVEIVATPRTGSPAATWDASAGGNVNPWGILLSGVTYTLNGLSWLISPVQTRNRANPCIPVGTINNITAVTNTFYAVPQGWYSLDQGCGQLANPLEAWSNEILWFYRQQCSIGVTNRLVRPTLRRITDSDVSDASNIKQGFTRLSDCRAGVFYPYCTGTQTCSGSIAGSGCMGPCPENDLGCQIDLDSKTYTCSEDTSTGIPLWVWLVIGGVGIIILLLLIGGAFVLLLGLSKKKKE